MNVLVHVLVLVLLIGVQFSCSVLASLSSLVSYSVS